MASASRAPAPPAASPFRTALIDLCFERGFAAVTVEVLCHRAGLDRAAFEERYADLEDCFFQICRGELERYRRQAAAARAGLGDWRARLRATAYALYRYLDEDERLRRFAVVEVRAAGERPALLIGEEIEELSDLIDEGRAEPTAPPTLTRATAESLGGGIFNQIYLAAGHAGPMPPEEEEVPEDDVLGRPPLSGRRPRRRGARDPAAAAPADTDRVIGAPPG